MTGAVLRMPFELGVSSYDQPLPDTVVSVAELDALRAADRFRFANRIDAWIEVSDGRIVGHGQDGRSYLGSTTLRFAGQSMTFAAVAMPDLRNAEIVSRPADDPSADPVPGVRFVQTGGGRTGVPAPRRVSRPPYVQVFAPMAWTTLSLTLWADGRQDVDLVGASPFPRHWLYDASGQLIKKSSTIDYHRWSTSAYGSETPWGANDSPAVVHDVETAIERALSERLMGERPAVTRHEAQTVLVRQGDESDEIYVLLDGILAVSVDGETLAELGPGVVVGERAGVEGGARTATLTAVTRITVASFPSSALSLDERAALAQHHHRED